MHQTLCISLEKRSNLYDVLSTVEINEMSAVNVGRLRLAGPGVSLMYNHILICHTHSNFSQFPAAGCHTTSVSSVPYWVIQLMLYAVSLVNDWHRLDGILSSPTLLGYGAEVYIVALC